MIISTSVFDDFMASNRLFGVALEADISDSEVGHRFLAARLPFNVMDDLKGYLQVQRGPVAVRSSSLFEDTFNQPFAGIYKTLLLPNNASNLDDRLYDLESAIKSVYASIYSRSAKSYTAGTGYRVEEMKMAVVLQGVVGKQYGKYFYPDVSGVARSVNFYPKDGEKSQDGVALMALGLGFSVVDRGNCVRIPIGSMMNSLQRNAQHVAEEFCNEAIRTGNIQTDFCALDMTKSRIDWAGEMLQSEKLKMRRVPLKQAQEANP